MYGSILFFFSFSRSERRYILTIYDLPFEIRAFYLQNHRIEQKYNKINKNIHFFTLYAAYVICTYKILIVFFFGLRNYHFFFKVQNFE